MQICKSRIQGPHAHLTEVKTDESSRGRETFYHCQTCSITLVNSSDLGKPGWRQAPVERRAFMPPHAQKAITAHA